jgi:hypothetical protein
LGEVEIIELNLSLDQYWIFLTPEGRKVSRPRHPRIVGPPKPSISSTVEIEASRELNVAALSDLIDAAHLDVRARLGA